MELRVERWNWEFTPFSINASARDYVVTTVRFSTNFYDAHLRSGYDVDTGFITERWERRNFIWL